MKNVAIYRNVFPVYSESFIIEQTKFLKNYKPIFITKKQLENTNRLEIILAAKNLKNKLFTVAGRGICSDLMNESIDLIHCHFGQDAFYAMKIAKKKNIPFIVTFHGQDCTVSDFSKLKSFQISNYHYLNNRNKIFKNASKIIAVSDFIKNTLIKQGCNPSKIITHYIGIDVDKFTQKKINVDKSNEILTILCVGRHTDKKGIIDLLQAIKILKEKKYKFQLKQIGKGNTEYTDYLKKYVKDNGLSEVVRFLGAVPHAEIEKEFQKADIFCLPSCTAKNGDSEALGLVFNEASAIGLPIVTTNHGGIPEVVKNNYNGILVQEKSPVDLACALIKLLEDNTLRKRLSNNGIDLVNSQFNLKKQTKLLEKIYEMVVDEWNSY
jgi:colanic acid/amylovoran biosynthesis glycosyltransferase